MTPPDARAILQAYAAGSVSRGAAMEQLGLEWYGDLLQQLHAHGLDRPRVSDDDAERMRLALAKLDL